MRATAEGERAHELGAQEEHLLMPQGAGRVAVHVDGIFNTQTLIHRPAAQLGLAQLEDFVVLHGHHCE